MPIAATASTGGGGNQTTGTTFAVTVAGADVQRGELVAVFIAADNQGTSGASSISSVTDSGSNSYSQIKLQNRTAASAAGDGCTCAIYASKVTTTLASGSSTITLNLSPTTVAKAVAYQAFSWVNTTTGTPVSSSGTGTTYTSTATASLAVGTLLLAACANESVTPPGADADSTGGTWVQSTQNSGGSGGDATKMALRWAYKVITAAGAQTFDGSTGVSTDWAAVAAMYSETPFVAQTMKGRVAWTPAG